MNHQPSQSFWRFRCKIFIFLCGILILVGCSKKSSTLDTNISQPPGWNSIIPGTTTSSEAVDKLQGVDYVDQSTIDVATQGVDYRKDSISWLFIKDSPDSRGDIFVKDNIVWLIIISPKEDHIDFKDVIDLFGEPEKVFAGSIPTQPIVTWLLYPEKGIAFNHIYGYIDTGEGARIRNNDDVLEVYYFAPDEFQSSFIGSDFLPVSLYNYERTAQDWEGYDVKLPVMIKYK